MQRTSRKRNVRSRCRIHPIDACTPILVCHAVRSECHRPRHWWRTHRLASPCRLTVVPGWYCRRPLPVVLRVLVGKSCLCGDLACVQVALRGHVVSVSIHRWSSARQTWFEVTLRALPPVIYLRANASLTMGSISLAARDDRPREVMRVWCGWRSRAA